MLKMRTAISGLVAAAAIVTLFTAAPASAAPIPGCSGNVCISLYGQSGDSYAVTGSEESVGYVRPVGHIHLTGPGSLDQNSTDKKNPVITGGSVGHGRACAEFWELIYSGHWELRGTACLDV